MAFTYFFRDLQTLELIRDRLIPFAINNSKINIWDAGCANGPEPYSLAIILAEKMGYFTFKKVNIFATDLDLSNQFGNIIENGIYKSDEVARIPDEIRQKYFENIEDSKFQVSYPIRARMKFFKDDLLNLNPPSKGFSLVLCKNVLLHLKYEERIEVIKMFHKSLLPGGFFAMEHTQELPTEVEHLFKRVVNNARLYQKC